MKKITIHRALTELKTLDARINKAINNIIPIGIQQEGKLVNNIYDKDTFIANAKENYQSINDLVDQKVKIKSAIIQSNSTTTITIDKQLMTVADAINFKTIIIHKEDLINTFVGFLNSCRAKQNKETERIEQIALDNAKIMLGKQTDNSVQPTDKDVREIMEPFIARNKLNLIDPLDLDTTIKKLQLEVDNFSTEIDAVLSESNATTFIEID